MRASKSQMIALSTTMIHWNKNYASLGRRWRNGWRTTSAAIFLSQDTPYWRSNIAAWMKLLNTSLVGLIKPWWVILSSDTPLAIINQLTMSSKMYLKRNVSFASSPLRGMKKSTHERYLIWRKPKFWSLSSNLTNSLADKALTSRCRRKWGFFRQRWRWLQVKYSA